jgi:hypothetical protein
VKKGKSMKIQLGSLVRDVYTGFEGFVTWRSEWLYGCTRYGVQPLELDKDGKPQEEGSFDEQRLELLAAKAPRVSRDSAARIGGPRQAPQRPLRPKSR